MNGDPPSHPPRQQILSFASNTVGPGLPQSVDRELRDLLVQMLVAVVRKELETPPRGGEDEREDP
jgi:hypothetical protein